MTTQPNDIPKYCAMVFNIAQFYIYEQKYNSKNFTALRRNIVNAIKYFMRDIKCKTELPIKVPFGVYSFFSSKREQVIISTFVS